MQIIEIYVEEDDGERLDIYLTEKIRKKSRTFIQDLVKKGLVKVNNEVKKPKYLVQNGDHITVKIPESKKTEIKPEKISLDIIYEDENIAIVNKPQGMVVHPSKDNYSNTLVNSLLYYFKNLSDIAGSVRPGIVHRLDKDTSGLLIIAKDNYSHEKLSYQFKKRTVKRVYYALVHGNIDLDNQTIKTPFGRNSMDRTKMAVKQESNREAITYLKTLERYEDYTLVEVELETGRMHQIRVHMSYINHPVVGDVKYNNRKNEFGIKGQLLHAKKIGFVHPTKDIYMEFDSNLPEQFEKVLNILRNRDRR